MYTHRPGMGGYRIPREPLIVVLLSILTPSTESLLIHGNVLSSAVKTFTEKAGFPAIQDLYNNAVFSALDVDGQSLVTEISTSLGSKFNGPIAAARRIKDVVEQEEDNFSPTLLSSQCCEGVGVSYSSQFRSEVRLGKTCMQISGVSSPNKRYPTQAVEDAMIENARANPNLKWQYFASEEGYYLSYPSVKIDDCSTYDPRFRPFYVETATPVAKDVVVILDRSGSMAGLHQGRTLLQIAKDATNTVLETLNPNDRVSVVAFESNAAIVGESERSCLNSELAMATPHNQKYLKRKINSLRTGAATDYEAALTKAFDVLERSSDVRNSSEREQVILFLTDGKKTEGGDPLMTIAQRNHALGNKVIIFTYALGDVFTAADKKLLEDMALQTQTNSAYGEVKPGQFKQILDPSLLRSSMASYYNRFSSDEKLDNPIFSVPYQDLFGIGDIMTGATCGAGDAHSSGTPDLTFGFCEGLITSVCLPVYKSSGDLLGVACSDVTMADLLSDITYFTQGELSYAFIIDGRGRTLMHPQLPQPSQLTDDPIFVHIDHLERAPDAAFIVQQMMLGTSGKKTLMSKRTIPRGSVLYEGIETRSVLSTYAWGPVFNSNLSMAIVVGDGDTLAQLETTNPQADAFHYHRLDWASSQNNYCKHFRRYATKDFSTVMLTPGAFREPMNYLDTTETQQNVSDYENFLRGVSFKNPGLKESVIHSVTLTYGAEANWKSNQEQADLVLWRYIGTTDGVMRLYPGVQLPKNYDHTRRPWYTRTLALKDQLVFSAPYLDLWSLEYIITVATTITEKRNGVTTPVVAVTGTDVRIPVFYELLLNSYDMCTQTQYRCLVVDSSGMVVIHTDFVMNVNGDPEIENMHIITKEPTIAEDLLENNYMIKTSCLDFENIKEQFSYRVVVSIGTDRMSSRAGFEIHPVSNTNIFVIIKKSAYTSPLRSCCTSYGVAPDQKTCGGISCDCLCYNELYYNYCLNRYPLLSDAAPTCSPQPPELKTDSLSENEQIAGLESCFDPKCTERNIRSNCQGVSGCSWCYRDQDGGDLSEPFCGTIYQCSFGTVAEDVELPCVGDACDEEAVVGPIIGGIIAAIVIIVIIACVIVHRRKTKQDQSSHSTSSYGHTNHTYTQSSLPPAMAQTNFTSLNVEPSAPPSDAPPPYTLSVNYSNASSASAYQTPEYNAYPDMPKAPL